MSAPQFTEVNAAEYEVVSQQIAGVVYLQNPDLVKYPEQGVRYSVEKAIRPAAVGTQALNLLSNLRFLERDSHEPLREAVAHTQAALAELKAAIASRPGQLVDASRLSGAEGKLVVDMLRSVLAGEDVGFFRGTPTGVKFGAAVASARFALQGEPQA